MSHLLIAELLVVFLTPKLTLILDPFFFIFTYFYDVKNLKREKKDNIKIGFYLDAQQGRYKKGMPVSADVLYDGN